MSFPQNIDPQIWRLVNAVCEGTISEQEFRELELLLETDASARDFYIDFLKINAEISWLVSAKQHSTMDLGPRVLAYSLMPKPNQSPGLGFLGGIGDFLNHHSLLSFVSLFAIFVVTLLATTFWLTTQHPGKVPAEPEFIARITVMKDCQWSQSAPQPTKMMSMQAGQKLILEKGIAQITYTNGAVVLLEGPASFTSDSEKSGFLSRGKLTARADTKESRQFAILTPDARFVDLGTEFGVRIDDKGRAAVAVFAGKINAEAKRADGRWSDPVSLSKGEAALCVGAKFTAQVALRSDFPTLQPQLPPAPSFLRWQDASRELQKRQDLVAYYDFQPDPNNPKVLLNRALTGAALNGEIQNAAWVEGRFYDKKALEFMSPDSGVRVNLPGEFRQLTVIAWIRSKQLANKYNGILMSDDWYQIHKLHFQLQGSGQIIINIYGQLLNKQENGQDDYCSTKAIPADCLNHWCMIAGVIDTPNQTSLYLDGEYFETLKSVQIPAVQIGSAMIGAWDKENSLDVDAVRNLSGRLDELMIFQNALSAEEIKQIYDAGKP
jgi:hypothetical protein